VLVLEPNDGIICVADDDDVALRALPPLVCPLVKNIVQVDVRKQRRNHRALRSPSLRLRPDAIIDYSPVEPFSDQSQDSRVGNPFLDHFHQEFFVEVIEKALDVDVEHPAHFLPSDADIKRVERSMLAAFRAEPVGEAPKIFLVNLIEDRNYRALDNLILQRCNSQRS
jgi:hypothetical protein